MRPKVLTELCTSRMPRDHYAEPIVISDDDDDDDDDMEEVYVKPGGPSRLASGPTLKREPGSGYQANGHTNGRADGTLDWEARDAVKVALAKLDAEVCCLRRAHDLSEPCDQVSAVADFAPDQIRCGSTKTSTRSLHVSTIRKTNLGS